MPNGIPGSYQPTVSATGDVARFAPTGMNLQPIPVQNIQFPSTAGLPMPESFRPPVTIESGFPGVQPLQFDFAAETRTAYESLKPFYDKLLSFAGGDLDLAKRRLQTSYEQGTREAEAEFAHQERQQAITNPVEQERQITEQNRRGILESGFGATERGRLQESQNLRKEAIQRALENRESRLGAERGFGMEQQQRGFERQRFDLERQRRGEASGMAQDKFGLKRSQFESELQQAQREESRRTQAAANRATAGFMGGGSSGGGGGGGNTGGTFEQMMARSGKQSEMDKARGQSGEAYEQLKRSYGY